MKKKVRIKNFDVDNKTFQSESEVMRLNKVEVDLSRDKQCYPLLLNSLIFNLKEDGIPDVENKTMISELKNCKDEIHQKIKALSDCNPDYGGKRV